MLAVHQVGRHANGTPRNRLFGDPVLSVHSYFDVELFVSIGLSVEVRV